MSPGKNTKIANVTVQLTDGKWCTFTLPDLQAVSDFAFPASNFWLLMEFITSLAYAPADPNPEPGGEA